jgi:hypothetical protein
MIGRLFEGSIARRMQPLRSTAARTLRTPPIVLRRTDYA